MILSFTTIAIPTGADIDKLSKSNFSSMSFLSYSFNELVSQFIVSVNVVSSFISVLDNFLFKFFVFAILPTSSVRFSRGRITIFSKMKNKNP